MSADSNSSIGSIKTSATYANYGSQLASQTNSSGYTTTYTYDSYRRVIGSEDNAGTLTQSRYIDSNDRVSMSYQSGVVSTHFYYTAGMLTSVVRGGYISGNSTKQNQTYSMAYDSFGNMTSIAVGSRTLATYQYGSNNGNLQSMTYGNGHTVSYEYDDLGRVTVEKWNGSAKYRYFYNSEGYLSQKLDTGTKKAVNYEYDSLGRLIGSYLTDEYDQSSKTITGILQRTEHLYDTANRISSQSWMLKDDLSSADGSYTTYTESYTYRSSDGALSTMTPAVGNDITFSYDVIKRLSGQSNGIYNKTYDYRDISSSRTTTQVASLQYAKVNSNSISAFTLNYTYDNVGNIASIDTGFVNGDASYEYDQQGQLIEETNYKGTYTYTYDTYGNIRSVSGTESHTYTYGDSNWLDLLTAYDGHSIAYDAIGNPTNWYNTTDWTLTWQNGRQLQKAVSDDTTVSYVYDVTGCRSQKKVVGPNGTTYSNYLTHNGHVIREWNGTVTVVLDFIYDSSDRPYAMVYNGVTYYYVLNQQGDVIRITNSSGATVATYVYDAWGKLISSSGSMAEINPLRYRGYYYDTETGFYYVSSRYYDPEIGRWINADIPETIIADFENFAQYNLFAYCFNNPVNLSDETGTWPDWATKLAIGVGAIVVGAAVVAATAATGGAAAAFVGAAVAGLKAAAVSGAVGAGTSAVSYRVSTGSWSGAGKAAIDGAVDGFASGFMTGGIMAGGSQILSSGFKVAANAGVPTGRNGGLTIGNKVRVLSPNHPQAYEAGGTLLKIGSKYKNIRFDVGSNSLFHMNIQLAKTANYHLPIGILGSGLWGGIARD